MAFEVKIYVGIGKDKDGVSLHPYLVEKGLERARFQLASDFGGYSEYHHIGGWIHGGQLIQEPGVTFAVVTDDVVTVGGVARYIRDAFRQTAVLVTKTPVESEFV